MKKTSFLIQLCTFKSKSCVCKKKAKILFMKAYTIMEMKLSNNILDTFSFLKNMAGIKLFFMFSERYILSLKIHLQPKHQLYHFNFFKQQTAMQAAMHSACLYIQCHEMYLCNTELRWIASPVLKRPTPKKARNTSTAKRSFITQFSV